MRPTRASAQVGLGVLSVLWQFGAFSTLTLSHSLSVYVFVFVCEYTKPIQFSGFFRW